MQQKKSVCAEDDPVKKTVEINETIEQSNHSFFNNLQSECFPVVVKQMADFLTGYTF